ncbi:tRNA (guanine(10)-N(2))-dimethyltransferase [Candidatus Woesearchaeota archaeon]|nr:tRNA (guanine(10)-N(2))-dimethyltransferase [Candidatus Woesearchaeota archaeon]
MEGYKNKAILQQRIQYQTITEGKATVKVPKVKIVSKAMETFYNPVMKFNRDIAIILLKALNKKHLRIADPLAGTGIRGARFLKELPASIVEQVAFNDNNKNFKKTMQSLIKLNKLPKKKISTHTQDASLFLLNSEGFDYIDIDPFGSPNHYLDAAIKRLSRNGILAVTATDTSALAGTHPKACQRKYWATPLKNEIMHEVGIRILVRKAQLVGAQHDKALQPIFSHATEHYYRIYFECIKGKKAVDNILAQHQYLLFCTKCRQTTISKQNNSNCCKKESAVAGPLWAGRLWNTELVTKMLKQKQYTTFLQTILEESKTNITGFYSLPKLASIAGVPVAKKETIIKELTKRKFVATQTHFAGDAIKTNASSTLLNHILSRHALKQRNL